MKIIDEIKAKVTGQTPIIPKGTRNFITITEDLSTQGLCTTMKEYKIGVNLHVVGHCRDEDFHFVKKNCIHTLRDYLYGELREKLLELERTIYEENFRQAREKVRELLKELYE